MCVSQNNIRLFLTIVLGLFLVSGCSGHSLKYGANSEGEELTSQEGMNGTGEASLSRAARNPDGTLMHGGQVDGNNPFLRSGQGTSNINGAGTSEMSAIDGVSSAPGSGSDYGREFGGVDGRGPHHGGVTGFGSGSANASNPDPEAWANAYLQGEKSSQEFYGDPSTTGSSSFSGNGETANYGHNYAGVPGSGPNHGAVEGFNQGSASSMETNPEAWAQAYMRENGGPSPEHVSPDMNIVQAKGQKKSHSIGMHESQGEPRAVGHASSGFDGRIQDIYFAFDSWKISVEGARYLEEDAQWLQANPEKALTIEGHCDQRGTQDYNLVLGKKRAEAAREYLINLGIQAYRVKIVSYGKERPFCQNSNEACFQENRRNHMVIRMNQS